MMLLDDSIILTGPNFFQEYLNDALVTPTGSGIQVALADALTNVTPGGSNTQIQFNNGGLFGGISTTGSGLVALATAPSLTGFTVVNGGSSNSLTVAAGSTTAATTSLTLAGTGDLSFFQSGTHRALVLRDATNAVNGISITQGATGAGATIAQTGDAAGTLKLGAGTLATAGIVNSLTPLVVSGGVQFGKATTFTTGSGIGGPGSTNVAPLWYNTSVAGTVDTGTGTPFFVQIADTMAMTAANYTVWNVKDFLNAGFDGPRCLATWTLRKAAATANPAGPSGNGWWNTLSQFFMQIDVGDGGTQAAPLGLYTMLNPDLRVNTGDWVSQVINTEFDLRLFAGTNSPTKINLSVHYGLGDGSHASPKTGDPANGFIDAAIVFDASPAIGNGSGKGLTMMQFGNFTQDVPWDTTAGIGTSLMNIGLNTSGNLLNAEQTYIDYGFKLPALYVRQKFIDNGVFSVDGPTGNVKAGLATVAATSSGASLDVTGVVAVSAVVVSGGDHAIVGSTIVDTAGSIWEVATVSGTGGAATAATVTLIRAAPVSAAPANPVSAFMGGSSTAVTLTVTWSAARSTLTLQPSGGAIALNSTSGPTITTGSAAASGTQPKGSIYLRTGGGVGTTLYVSQGGGVWNAVAGV